MKNIRLYILLVCLLAFTGCNDEEARIYAQKLKQVLGSYQEQVNNKLVAEKRAYRQLAAISARVREEDIIETLYIERNERSRKIAEGLLKDSTFLSVSQIRGLLQSYAAIDFEQTRSLLEQESAAISQYLQDLESLEVDAKKIKALGILLDDLGEGKSKLRHLKQLADFVEKADVENDKLVCADLTRERVCLQKKLGPPASATEQAAIKEQIKKLDEKIERRKRTEPRRCPADQELNRITCPSNLPQQ
jgi:hypothetical protein